MPRILAVCLAAGVLAARPVSGQRVGPPLCQIGSSVVDYMYGYLFSSDSMDTTSLSESVAFVAECPRSVLPYFGLLADDAPKLRRAWIEAVSSAAAVPSNRDLRAFLAAAKRSVDRVSDDSLTLFFGGMLDAADDSGAGDPSSLDSLYERQSVASLKHYARCDGAGCTDVSDFLLFLLGTRPLAFFRAMHADSTDATAWLGAVADLSFALDPRDREWREAARAFVLKRIADTNAIGFAREKRACEHTLRGIRYRAWG